MSAVYMPTPPEGAETFEVLAGVQLPVVWFQRAKAYVSGREVTAFQCLTALARSHDIAAMQAYLQQGGSINVSAHDGNDTLVSHALTYGRSLSMIEFLLKQPDLNLENRGSLNETLIFAALRRKNTWDQGVTSREKAAEKLKILELVLNKNPDLSVQNVNGDTALMFAAKENQEMLEVLLAHNPPLFTQNNAGDSAYTYALRAGVVKRVFTLLSRINAPDQQQLNARDKNGHSFLYTATFHLNAGVVRAILETYKRFGIQPSPIHFCEAWMGLPPIDHTHSAQKIASHIAESIKVAELLFAAGASMNDVHAIQRINPLIAVLEKYNWDMALFLLNYQNHAQPAIDYELVSARNWNALCYLVCAVKEMPPELFQDQRAKMSAIYALIIARMSPGALAYTALQMQIPVERLQTQDISTLRLPPPLPVAQAIPLQAPGAAAQALEGALRIDLQSTHRREVHFTTTQCALVLHARHAESLKREQYVEISGSLLRHYAGPGWLDLTKRRAYFQNLSSTVKQPIPGDELGTLKARLTEKLKWIMKKNQQYQALKNHCITAALVEGMSAADHERATLQLCQNFATQFCNTDWASHSLSAFLKLLLTDTPYANWTDPGSNRTVAQVLILLWSAMDDPRYALTVAQKGDLMVQIGLALFDALHENGVGHPSCAPGTFNALMDVAARSGYIPGLYVLSNAAEGAAIKQQLTQKLSMNAQFEMLHAEQRMTWFESPEAYEAAKQQCIKEQEIFKQFGENERFKFFTEAELAAFEQALVLSWEEWTMQQAEKRPTLEEIAISKLKGMSESQRVVYLVNKRKFTEEEGAASDPLAAAMSMEEPDDMRIDEVVMNPASVSASLEPPRKRRAGKVRAVACDGGEGLAETEEEQEEAFITPSERYAAEDKGKGKRKVDEKLDDLERLMEQIVAEHPVLATPHFDLRIIQRQFGLPEQSYTLVDYSSQLIVIRNNPADWVNSHWNQYYMTLTQEALRQLLSQMMCESTGDRNADLKLYAERDLERLLVQCQLNREEGPGKIIHDDYQVWLEHLDLALEAPGVGLAPAF